MKRLLFAALLLATVGAAHAAPQRTAFTYQGNLTANGAPANGNFDLVFTLYDAASGGNTIGTPIVLLGYSVTNGRFSTELDFPTAFSGAQRWIEVSVGGAVLTPRQAVDSAPIAIGALTCCSPQTLVVSAGTDTQQNGTNLLAAMSRIAAQAPSASNGFLLKLEPGIYDLGSSALQLQPYVQLEGAGEGITQVSGAGQSSSSSAVVLIPNDSQIRNLSVISRSGNSYSNAIYADNTATTTTRISHVTVQVADGSNSGSGIVSNGGAPLIENVSVSASNTTAGGLAYGILLSGGAAQVTNSSIRVQSSGSGQANGVYLSTTIGALIGDVQITASSSGAPAGNASPDAVGIGSDASSYVVQGTRIAISANGGGSGVGMAMNNSTSGTVNASVENSSITVTTTNTAYAQGILNNTSSAAPENLVVRGTSISVKGSAATNCESLGVNSFGGAVTAYGSSVSTSAGAGCAAYALVLQGSGTFTFNNGSVSSTQYSIYNASATSLKIGASQVSALNPPLGPATCIDSFKADYTATSASCS